MKSIKNVSGLAFVLLLSCNVSNGMWNGTKNIVSTVADYTVKPVLNCTVKPVLNYGVKPTFNYTVKPLWWITKKTVTSKAFALVAPVVAASGIGGYFYKLNLEKNKAHKTKLDKLKEERIVEKRELLCLKEGDELPANWKNLLTTTKHLKNREIFLEKQYNENLLEKDRKINKQNRKLDSFNAEKKQLKKEKKENKLKKEKLNKQIEELKKNNLTKSNKINNNDNDNVNLTE